MENSKGTEQSGPTFKQTPPTCSSLVVWAAESYGVDRPKEAPQGFGAAFREGPGRFQGSAVGDTWANFQLNP